VTSDIFTGNNFVFKLNPIPVVPHLTESGKHHILLYEYKLLA